MPSDIAGPLIHFEDVDGNEIPVAECRRRTDGRRTGADHAPGCIATAAQLNLRLAPASLEERAVLVESLADDLQQRIDALDIEATSILLEELPEGQEPVRAVPAGLATVGIGLLENLSANRAALTYLALSLAGLYLVLRTRSLGRALLALVPVFLAIGLSSLIVWMLDITLSPLTTVVGSVGRRQCRRVLGADHGSPHRGTPGRARSGGRDPHRRPAHRACVLHVGVHDHRRLRCADLVVAPVAARLRIWSSRSTWRSRCWRRWF